jgi:prefoldin subunit 5
MKSISLLFSSFFIFIFFLGSCSKEPIDYSKAIDVLNANVAALKQRSDSLSTALANTNTNLSNLNKTVDSIKVKLTAIQTQIESLKLSLTAVNANISSINAQIESLNQKYTTLLDQLNAILAILNGTPPTLSNGLIAYYPFSGNAADSSGNGNFGTVFNAILANDRFGKSNSAYQFNGTTSFIDVTNKFFDNGWINSTVSLWFNATTNQSQAIYGGQTLLNTNATNGFAVGYSYQNSQRIYVWKGSNPASGWDILGNNVFNINPVKLNQWYLITIVKSGLNYTYYVNGELDKSITTSINPTPNTLYPIRIGGVITPLTTDNRELFTGRIDDIRIYNRALTQNEISYLASH